MKFLMEVMTKETFKTRHVSDEMLNNFPFWDMIPPLSVSVGSLGCKWKKNNVNWLKITKMNLLTHISKMFMDGSDFGHEMLK